MSFVAGNEVEQGARAHRAAPQIPDAGGNLVREAVDERHRGRAHGEELVQDGLHRASLEVRGWDVGVLVESREWRRIVARDAKRPVGQNALAVAQMTDHL